MADRQSVKLVQRRPTGIATILSALACAFFLFSLTASHQPANAQAKPARVVSLPELIKGWETTLTRADAAVRRSSATKKVLETWQVRVRDVLRAARAALATANKRLARQKALVKALGPAPGAGKTEEAEASKRRAELHKALGIAEQGARILALIVKRAETIQSRIGNKRTDVLTARLMSSGPAFWSPTTWRRAFNDMSKAASRLAAATADWFVDPQIIRWLKTTGPFELVLYLLLVLLLVLWLRRGLDRSAGQLSSIEAPDRYQRLLGTLVILFNYGVAPATLILAVLGLMAEEELLVGLFGSVLRGVAIGLALFFFIRGGARAALAPRHPAWRVVAIGDQGARQAYRLALILAGLMAFDEVLEHLLDGLRLSAEFTVVTGIFINGGLAIALIMVSAKHLWAAPAASAARAPQEERNAAAILRYLARLSGMATLIAIFFNYHNLAQLLAENSAITGFILGGGWVIRYVVAELLDQLLVGSHPAGRLFRRRFGLPEDGASIPRIWLLLLFDFVLAGAVFFLLVLVWGTNALSAFETLRDLWHGVTVGGVAISLRDILIAILTFVGLVMLVRSVQRQFEERIGKHARMDIGIRRALRAGIGYAGIILAAAIGISLAGFDLSNLAIIAGALSVGIGFGLQAIVNNFVSGIILFVERPVKEGDWIVVDRHEGFVKRIGVRATEITTFQNASVIIPNSKLISEPVKNWLHKDQSGRIEIKIGVAYGSNTELVRDVLMKCTEGNELIAPYPAPQVLFTEFADSALSFELRVYARNIVETFRLSSELRFAIDKAFRENGITIPFPQRDLHVKNWPGPPPPS